VDNFNSFYDPIIKRNNIAHHLEKENFNLIEGDIRNFDFLKKKLNNHYDIIIHLAAMVGVQPSLINPLLYQDVNVKGTQNLLELAKILNINQFVFASSSSVYGINQNVPWKEFDHVLKPISPYASTKISAELMGHVYSHLYGIRFLALRFFTVYGPRQRPDLAIHKFFKQIYNNLPITIFGNGTTSRDYTYVDDVIKAIKNAMGYNKTNYEIFNIGNSKTITIRELVKQIERITEKRVIINYENEQPGDVPKTYADISKAKMYLNYNPSTSIIEGLEAFNQWYRNNYKGSL